MSARFDDMARTRDALYQALRPSEDFEAAISVDKAMAECLRIGGLHGIARINRKDRDAALLPLAIRGLISRQEVTPGND